MTHSAGVTDSMTDLPMITFANSDVSITRLISGGNALRGYSHFSQEMDTEMSEYFTDENLVAYLHELEALERLTK